MAGRLSILKTYKLYINGQFPRTESGRYFTARNKKGEALANMCQGSKKDFRDAVVAARAAWKGWSGRAAFNRGQILYRIAEMLEGRKAQFVEELMQQDASRAAAEKEVELCIDRLVYYSGWCDKYQPLFGTVNPVASPHFNFSVPESSGVVAAIAPQDSSLLGLVSVIAPLIAGGNTVIVVGSETLPLCAITFGEVIHASDVPGGVVNILTGSPKELVGVMSTHMDVNAIVYCGTDPAVKQQIRENAATNVKRALIYDAINWRTEAGQSPYFILDAQEIKTTWHPVESGNAGGAKY